MADENEYSGEEERSAALAWIVALTISKYSAYSASFSNTKSPSDEDEADEL